MPFDLLVPYLKCFTEKVCIAYEFAKPTQASAFSCETEITISVVQTVSPYRCF